MCQGENGNFPNESKQPPAQSLRNKIFPAHKLRSARLKLDSALVLFRMPA
jgi:hypothetical protein